MSSYMPMHPGEYLKEVFMEPLELTVTDLAKKIGVSKSAISRLIAGKAELSYEMAIRLGKEFNRTPASLMNLQTNYGLYMAEANLNKN